VNANLAKEGISKGRNSCKREGSRAPGKPVSGESQNVKVFAHLKINHSWEKDTLSYGRGRRSTAVQGLHISSAEKMRKHSSLQPYKRDSERKKES